MEITLKKTIWAIVLIYIAIGALVDGNPWETIGWVSLGALLGLIWHLVKD